MKVRIILTFEHAKRFTKALNENIKKFEAQHGTIAEAEQMPSFPMNFNTPKAEA